MKKEICSWFIDHFTSKGDIVLDCFSGLGTTAICCEEQGRNFIGFEISPEYHRMSLERLEENMAQVRFDI